MGWDSNPRYACTYGGFQDRCLKPLGHPSHSGENYAAALRISSVDETPLTLSCLGFTTSHAKKALLHEISEHYGARRDAFAASAGSKGTGTRGGHPQYLDL